MTQEGRTMQFRVPNGQCHPGDSSVPLVQLQVTKSRRSSFGFFWEQRCLRHWVQKLHPIPQHEWGYPLRLALQGTSLYKGDFGLNRSSIVLLNWRRILHFSSTSGMSDSDSVSQGILYSTGHVPTDGLGLHVTVIPFWAQGWRMIATLPLSPGATQQTSLCCGFSTVVVRLGWVLWGQHDRQGKTLPWRVLSPRRLQK